MDKLDPNIRAQIDEFKRKAADQKALYDQYKKETNHLQYFEMPSFKDWMEKRMEHKASGGTTHSVTPTMAEMRMALMRTNPLNLQSYGADNASEMNPKAYVPPDTQEGVMPPPGGADLPTGGIDTDPTQAGQQLMPQQPQGVPPSPAGAAGQPAPQGPQGQGSPLQQPPSNILQMTPQGQALNAIKPPQPPIPAQGMKKGGEVHPDVWTMLYHLIMQGKHK